MPVLCSLVSWRLLFWRQLLNIRLMSLCLLNIQEIDLDSIVVSEFNTRKDLDAGTEDTSLDELASSIREKGLLSPVTVVRRKDGKFDLIVGQRRYLACKKLGMRTIPAVIREDLNGLDATALSLVENVHRADMSPTDKAKAYKALYDRYGSYERVAKETSVSLSTIRRYISLLGLTPDIQERIDTKYGVAGVEALSVLAQAFEEPEEQEAALKAIEGFKQDIQVEILKRSGGDIGKLPELRNMALEGAFHTVVCREGLCFAMPEDLKARIKRYLKETGSPGSSGEEFF